MAARQRDALRAQDSGKGEGRAPLDKNELRPHRQARRPAALQRNGVERNGDGAGSAAVARRRTYGLAVPDDVFRRQPLLPLCRRLAGEHARRRGRCAGPGHLVSRQPRAQLGIDRHHAAACGVPRLRLGRRGILPSQILGQQRERTVRLSEKRLLRRPRAHTCHQSPRRLPAAPAARREEATARQALAALVAARAARRPRAL